MRSAVLYAPGDVDYARELVRYLELNCPVTMACEECDVQPGFDLIDGVEQVVGEELTLVLLSPRSVPRPWPREKWEPVLIDQPKQYGTRLAFLLIEECRYPTLLRSKNFYDFSRDRDAGQRRLKRWILELGLPAGRVFDVPAADHAASNMEDAEALRSRICDRPGVAPDVDRANALAFAHQCRDDFEGVFWIPSAYRSRTAVIGEMGRSLGLNLAGTVDQNIEQLRNFCDQRRCLFIFDDVDQADRTFLAFSGRTSIIFTSQRALPGPRPLDEIAGLFHRWAVNSKECLHALGDAYSHLRRLSACHDESLGLRLQLAKAVVSMLRKLDRLAEAMEILELLRNARHVSGDMNIQAWLARERVRILDDWGEAVPLSLPVASPEPVQLTLEFGAA